MSLMSFYKRNTVLRLACEQNNHEMVDELYKRTIKTCGNTNAFLKYNWNIGLLAASAKGHLELVKKMISFGAFNLDKAFYYACYYDHRPIIEYLISFKTVNLREGFRAACFSGNQYLISDLFSYGFKEIKMKYACTNNNIEIVKYLIRNGAKDFDRGFDIACFYGHFDLAKFLATSFKIIDFMSAFRRICLSTSRKLTHRHVEIVQYLVDKINLVNISQKLLDSGVKTASKSEQLELVQYFVSIGASSKYALTSLLFYENKKKENADNRVQVLKFLVEQIDLRLLSEHQKRRLLIRACEMGDVELLSCITDNCAFTEKDINNGMSCAIEQGNYFAIEYLVIQYPPVFEKTITMTVNACLLNNGIHDHYLHYDGWLDNIRRIRQRRVLDIFEEFIKQKLIPLMDLNIVQHIIFPYVNFEVDE